MKPSFFFFLFLALVFLPLVSSQPPVSQIQQFAEGYVVEIPPDNILLVNQDYSFNFHVYNISTGQIIHQGISCYFHLYNSTGGHHVSLIDTTADTNFDYEFFIGKNNFTELGTMYYNVGCNETTLGGFQSSPIQITSTGKEFVSVFNNPYILIFLFLAVLFLMMGLYSKNPMFGFISSVMFLLLGIYLMIYGLNDATDLYTRGMAISLIGIGFIIMFVSAFEWIWGEPSED